MAGNDDFELAICVNDQLCATRECTPFRKQIYMYCTGNGLERHTSRDNIFIISTSVKSIIKPFTDKANHIYAECSIRPKHITLLGTRLPSSTQSPAAVVPLNYHTDSCDPSTRVGGGGRRSAAGSWPQGRSPAAAEVPTLPVSRRREPARAGQRSSLRGRVRQGSV